MRLLAPFMMHINIILEAAMKSYTYIDIYRNSLEWSIGCRVLNFFLLFCAMKLCSLREGKVNSFFPNFTLFSMPIVNKNWRNNLHRLQYCTTISYCGFQAQNNENINSYNCCILYLLQEFNESYAMVFNLKSSKLFHSICQKTKHKSIPLNVQ